LGVFAKSGRNSANGHPSCLQDLACYLDSHAHNAYRNLDPYAYSHVNPVAGDYSDARGIINTVDFLLYYRQGGPIDVLLIFAKTSYFKVIK
jgi:hypothetical protein